MKAYLLPFGCNEYQDPSANLKGCANDGMNVASVAKDCFNQVGWEVHLEFNKNNTAKRLKDIFRQIAGVAKAGDLVWLHNSSHGTTVVINDKKHHATVPYDFNWNDMSTFMLDTDYWELLSLFVPGVFVVFTTDSCFAQGLTSAPKAINPRETRHKFLQAPSQCLVGEDTAMEAHPRSIIGDKLDIAAGFGCLENQFSADVTDSSGSYGAYTHYLCQNIRKNPKVTFSQTHKAVNDDLKRDQFEQICAYDGVEVDFPWFGGFTS